MSSFDLYNREFFLKLASAKGLIAYEQWNFVSAFPTSFGCVRAFYL
jgi:hypothetical protein